MFSYIVLALLVPTSLTQTLDYVCTTQQEVKILKKGIESYQWMYASGVIEGGASKPCDVREANDTSAGYWIKFIISKCDLASPIQVTITTAREDKDIIGGKGAIGFEIKCNGILEGGENVTLHQTVLSKDKEFKMRHQEKPDQKMVIIAKNGTTLLDRSIVQIGDELNVIISTSGNFTFSIVSCEAQSENHRNRKLLINNGMAEDPSLMTVFNQSTDQKRSNAEAKLFAFHFVNSDYLELSCTIFVCRISDTTCKHIQKRSAPDEADNFIPMTESLQANFVVVDGGGQRSFGTSGAKSNSTCTCIYMYPLLPKLNLCSIAERDTFKNLASFNLSYIRKAKSNSTCTCLYM